MQLSTPIHSNHPHEKANSNTTPYTEYSTAFGDSRCYRIVMML
ncbi:Protein of unknown function [Pyronema omphalodes CBS 100304]|uniref:Uncharacterized protein n=1 Tax=Pyronema omphalodes (strain CBS 100304) TaxID=1076935 RepID=U4LI51_PYROM|nr:Protein of unknown function [Pyronema omphalodes CBS 100304]